MTGMKPGLSIKQNLVDIVSELWPQVTMPAVSLVRSERAEHGDYACNVAMIVAKLVGQPAPQVAGQIQQKFLTDEYHLEVVERIEVVGGFLNFFLRPNHYLDVVSEILDLGSAYGGGQDGLSATVLEFGQPNTHKMPHIGHLYSYIYGESCARLRQSVGTSVKRVNYQGDVGLHVAKCLWAYQKFTDSLPEALDQRVAWLQQCYQDGSSAYETDATAKEEIEIINAKIYNQDPEIMDVWQQTRQWSLDYYQQFEEELGVHYDQHYLESQIADSGKALVQQAVGSIFEESQGAVIFPGEKYGLHTRVFINQKGFPTYEAKDLGLAARKKDDYPDQVYVVTTAVEQNEYWRVIIKVIDLLLPSIAGRTKHLGFGMVELPSGKISSRTGNLITAFDLVATVRQRVGELLRRQRPEYSAAERDHIAQIVGDGAIKYAFLKKVAAKNMMFDLEASISLEGNSGPYIQYAYTRCRSLQQKAGEQTAQVPRGAVHWQDEELSLARHLSAFTQVVSESARDYAPHNLCSYLYQTAQKFSQLYDKHKIITDDQQTTGFRLALTAATAHVLKNGLHVLGIDVLDKM